MQFLRSETFLLEKKLLFKIVKFDDCKKNRSKIALLFWRSGLIILASPKIDNPGNNIWKFRHYLAGLEIWAVVLILLDYPRVGLNPAWLMIPRKGLPIVYSSDKFTYTTGYTRGDVLFKSISLEFMAGPKTDNAISMIENGMEKQETFQVRNAT